MVLFSAPPLYGMQAEPLKIRDMDIKILPEYDTSDVLVMYRIKFINLSPEPYKGEIRVPVPKDSFNKIVKEPLNPLDVPFVVRGSDMAQFEALVWSPAESIQPNAIYDVHLKYYYNPLSGAGYKKFQYSLQADLEIEQAKIYVYQPLEAVDFMMEPQGQAFGTNKEGFQIFGLNVNHLKKGERFALTVSYEKNRSGPSLQSLLSDSEPGLAQGFTPRQLVFVITVVMLLVFIVMIKRYLIRNRKILKEAASKAVNIDVLAREKRKLRQMLLKDEITEGAYHAMLYELERKYH